MEKNGSIDRLPEGWKERSLWCNFTLHSPELNGPYRFIIKTDLVSFAQNERFLLDLLKEMAEALEEMIEACDKGYARPITPMKQVLEKFRSWK